MSLHLFFTNIVKSVQNLIFYGSFQIFHGKLSYTHYRIVFIPHTHKTRFLPLILRSIQSFTLAFDF